MAVNAQGIGLINFEVYKGGTSRLLGIANVELPTVEMETVDMKGVAINGTVSMPIGGNTGSMELKLTWRVIETAAAELAGHKSIDLSLYGAPETYDGATGKFKVPQHRIEARVVPKSLNLGKWEPSSTVDPENTFEIVTLNYYIENIEQLAIDKFNFVYRAGGDSFFEEVKAALGLTNAV